MKQLKITKFPELDYAGSEAFNTLSTNLSFAGETVKKPLFNHNLTAVDHLFGWLKDETQRAVKAAGFGKIARGTQQYCGMSVMPTGMHQTRLFAGPGFAAIFINR